jgi:hypothetical protein
MFKAIEAPKEGAAALPEPNKYHALFIIRNHIHLDIKAEYLMEEDPRALWLALQQRYEQQKSSSRRLPMSGTTSAYRISNP